MFETFRSEFKDQSWEKHSIRVAELCEKFANKLNLSLEDTKTLKFAGLVHDIGFNHIDKSILLKSEKLLESEMIEIKKHPNFSYKFLEHSYSEVAECVLYHHERWDGKGYPMGLKEDEIPFHSRILTVIDAYEAMTSKRPHREALTVKEAQEELQRCSGTQFDPELVDLFIESMLE